MTIQTLSSSSIVIFIDDNELNTDGLNVDNINAETAHPLVMTAFAESGIHTSGSLEIEAFQGDGGVIVFARLVPLPHTAFIFHDFEELLRAVRALPSSSAESTLTYFKSTYLLIFSASEHEAISIMSEFANNTILSPVEYAHVCEHGKTLIEHSALSVLFRQFKP